MREECIAIDRLAYGGAGFGRIQGKACFVPFTVPGDLARVRILKETASYAEARLCELLESSPLRVSPPCSLFGRCGGCHWQQLGHPTQVAAKEELFAEALWRLARVERERLLPPLTTDAPWGYRSRVQLKLDGRGDEFRLGFFAPGSHSVVDLPDSCAVAHPAINEAIKALRQLLRQLPQRDRFSTVDLAAGEDGAVILTLHYQGERPERAAEFWRSRRHELPSVAGALLRQGKRGALTSLFGPRRLAYTVPATASAHDGESLELSFTAGAFSQVNYRQNRLLVRTALEWGNFTGRERVLDLCCGNGNFSLPMARHSREVIGLETGALAVADARHNAGALGIHNARFEVLDGAAGVRRFIAAGERFDLVLLDPPRSGAAEMAGLLEGLMAQKIIYVSCDPQTLGRDLARLQQGGYRVVTGRVVEMFPQTYHMESITLLERV